MNKMSNAESKPPFLHRGIRRGTLVGLLGQTGSWSLVAGLALLIERPDLPWPLPASLVVIGLGAIALSFLLLLGDEHP